jgi:hypothetical protein
MGADDRRKDQVGREFPVVHVHDDLARQNSQVAEHLGRVDPAGAVEERFAEAGGFIVTTGLHAILSTQSRREGDSGMGLSRVARTEEDFVAALRSYQAEGAPHVAG